MRIVLLAEEAAGLRVLRALARRKEDVVAVVTAAGPDKASPMSIANVASAQGFDVITTGALSMSDFAGLLTDKGVDILLNVHSLSILPSSVIEAPRVGSFNLHPGPLPQLAGLNAPSWAIYLGEEEHAVTLHWMLSGIDTGPIAFEEHFALSAEDTGFSVSARCVTAGVPLIERLLDTAHRSVNEIPKVAQDTSKRRFFNASDIPNNGWINWNDSAHQIAAFVRAADYGPFKSPWGSPGFQLGGQVFGVVQATPKAGNSSELPGTVIAVNQSSVTVATGNGLLEIQRLKTGDRVVPAMEALAGGQVLASAPPVQSSAI